LTTADFYIEVSHIGTYLEAGNIFRTWTARSAFGAEHAYYGSLDHTINRTYLIIPTRIFFYKR